MTTYHENSLMRVVKAVLTAGDDPLTSGDADDILAIVAGLVCGAWEPIPLRSAQINAEYRQLIICHPAMIDILKLKTRSLSLPEKHYDGFPVSRAAWYGYVLLRFTLRPRRASVLQERLRNIAVHHRQMNLDAEHAGRLVLKFEKSTLTRTLRDRADWWTLICNALRSSSREMSMSVASKLTLMGKENSLNAYKLFRHSGGHEGCLHNTPWEDLEPVLRETPSNANGLYIITCHMIKDVMIDGSLFSDEGESLTVNQHF
jgi:hypothetical protein